MKARTGKIARLPRAIRGQLNQRLADGMSGEALLDWLHSQPAVLEVLVRDFAARPILKQNLSEWRQGGFRDWEAQQERIETVRQIAEEAEELETTAIELPDRLSAIVAARFASLIAATAKVKDWSKPRQRAQLMELCEGIATLRRFDQGAARLKLEREQLAMKQAELQLAQEAGKKRTENEWREWAKAYHDKLIRECKTSDELLQATQRLIFGEVDREKEPAGGSPENDASTSRHKSAEQLRDSTANIVKYRDEIEADKADIEFQENQLKMREVEAVDAVREALREIFSNEVKGTSEGASDPKNRNLSTQESQGQSSPVKP